MSLRPGPPLDDTRASHDARVRWLLRAFPGSVVLSGPPAPLPRPVPKGLPLEDYRQRTYSATPPRPSRAGAR
jgi:hypothetical protein